MNKNILLLLALSLSSMCHAMQQTDLLTPVEGNGQLSKDDATIENLSQIIDKEIEKESEDNNSYNHFYHADEINDLAALEAQYNARFGQNPPLTIVNDQQTEMHIDSKDAKKANTKKHVVKKPNATGPFVCTKCNRSRTTRDGLKTHIIKKHCSILGRMQDGVYKKNHQPRMVGVFTCNTCGSQVTRGSCIQHMVACQSLKKS